MPTNAVALAEQFLEQWSTEEVQAWFQRQKDLAEFAPKFKRFEGASMANLTEGQLQREFGLDGSLIYNALQALKMPTKSALPPPPKTRN